MWYICVLRIIMQKSTCIKVWIGVNILYKQRYEKLCSVILYIQRYEKLCSICVIRIVMHSTAVMYLKKQNQLKIKSNVIGILRCIECVYCFGSMVILTTLILPIHEHRRSFHLLRSCQFLSSMFYSFHCRGSSHLLLD